MGRYVLRRLLMVVPLLFLITLVSFVIIQLPPGDYLTTYIARLSAAGQEVNEAEKAVALASKTVRNIRYVEVVQSTAQVEDGEIKEYRVQLKLGFEYEE